MRLSFEQRLPAPPAAVWPFLVEPDLLARWSLASVRSLAPGDGDSPGGVGALRRITIHASGAHLSFDEVVERAEPPRRFVYRVVRGLPLRDHRGEILLEAEGAGSLLCWEVDFDLLVPGAEIVARRVLDVQLRRSLAALARVVEDAAPATLDTSSFADDVSALVALETEADGILSEQRALADRFGHDADPKYWFARVYQYVTEGQLAFCRDGRLTHRAWVMRLLPRFHAYYAGNLRRYVGDLPGTAESHWQVAFRAMDRGSRGATAAVAGLLHGVAAHIEDDLPRALAEVYRSHYRGRCSYARFRADYLLMADIFTRASDRLMAEMPRSFLPLYLRVLDPVLSVPVKDRFLRRYYDVPAKRRQAFERGARLAAWAG